MRKEKKMDIHTQNTLLKHDEKTRLSVADWQLLKRGAGPDQQANDGLISRLRPGRAVIDGRTWIMSLLVMQLYYLTMCGEYHDGDACGDINRVTLLLDHGASITMNPVFVVVETV